MMKKVLIDPGHSVDCPNRGIHGYKEFYGMWKLSNFLKEILTASGVSADLTRTESEDPPLDKRGGMANGYDFFISEHSNAANGAARGVECFYSVTKPNDKVIAAKLAAAVSSVMNNPDRGAKTRESEKTKGNDYYGVIRSAVAAGCPHVFLIESGFHDNWLDEEILLKDENLKRIAEAQARVILEALGVSETAPSPAAKNPIMGASVLTAEQLAAFLIKHNPSPKINCSALELAELFISEGNIEGVRGDIAFMQSLHETGHFRYGGQVLPEQNNFAGIGATNNSPVGKGAWFDTPQLGVRAQLQHLKAYASKEPLKQECVDPRFGLVTRGISPNWEDLNGRWAVPGPTYGQSILKLYGKAREFAIDLVPPVIAAINTLVKHGVISSPDYWTANHGKLEYLDALIINMAERLAAK
jgi:N-acetylmuramoyl-L-alanine amidase